MTPSRSPGHEAAHVDWHARVRFRSQAARWPPLWNVHDLNSAIKRRLVARIDWGVRGARSAPKPGAELAGRANFIKRGNPPPSTPFYLISFNFWLGNALVEVLHSCEALHTSAHIFFKIT